MLAYYLYWYKKNFFESHTHVTGFANVREFFFVGLLIIMREKHTARGSRHTGELFKKQAERSSILPVFFSSFYPDRWWNRFIVSEQLSEQKAAQNRLDSFRERCQAHGGWGVRFPWYLEWHWPMDDDVFDHKLESQGCNHQINPLIRRQGRPKMIPKNAATSPAARIERIKGHP